MTNKEELAAAYAAMEKALKAAGREASTAIILKALAGLTDKQLHQFSRPHARVMRLARRRLVQAGVLPRELGPQRSALKARREKQKARRAAR